MTEVDYKKKCEERGNRFKDLTGIVFGKLTVIEFFVKSKNGHAKWLCKCECGNKSICFASNLLRGIATSCGCYGRNIIGNNTRKHGMSKTRIFKIWAGIKKRCTNPKCKTYHLYGGRGIKLCGRWQSFENFYADTKDTYKSNLSLDRFPNQDGDYCPENYRWATSKAQNNNRRNNFIIEIMGQTKTLSEWSSLSGISASAIKYRINNGWNANDAVYKPTIQNNSLRSVSKYLIF